MPPAAPVKQSRLASLDVLRGFTVLLMVFVDEVGDAFPHINHSPWNNVTLADFVMPWFLFMVGTSIFISLRKYRAARRVGTRAVFTRALKLYGLGLLLQGGGFPSGYKYGYNLATARFTGILNRIGYAYLVAGLVELWIPERPTPSARRDRLPSSSRVQAMWPYTLDSSRHEGRAWPHCSVFSTQVWRWLIVLGFVALHLALTFLTFVPSWTSHYGVDAHFDPNRTVLLPEAARFPVVCNVRGAIDSPQCSATSFYDRAIFGQSHLGVWMSYRLPECSGCSPGAPSEMYRPECRAPPNATSVTGDARWCFAHMYDPEGLLSTIPSIGSVWLGVHFGRVLRADGIAGRHGAIVAHWALCAAALVAAGLALHVTCLPMNKQLWSTSYLLFMAGSCGAALTAIYVAIDVRPSADGGDDSDDSDAGSTERVCVRVLRSAQSWLRWLLFPLQAMGMNAILFFFWHGPATTIINAVFLDPETEGMPSGHLLRSPASSALLGQHGWLRESVLALAFPHDAAKRQLTYVVLKCAVFLAVAVACYRRRYFWKI
jgi:heparan-alpha-glucosaminide N-acetyltransferase